MTIADMRHHYEQLQEKGELHLVSLPDVLIGAD